MHNPLYCDSEPLQQDMNLQVSYDHKCHLMVIIQTGTAELELCILLKHPGSSFHLFKTCWVSTEHACLLVKSCSSLFYAFTPFRTVELPTLHWYRLVSRQWHGSLISCFCCREWSSEERAVWEERDRQEQVDLAGHANAPTTPQEQHLPGTLAQGFAAPACGLIHGRQHWFAPTCCTCTCQHLRPWSRPTFARYRFSGLCSTC